MIQYIKVVGRAVVTQLIAVEADTREDAMREVFDNEAWNDGVWVYGELDDDSPVRVAQ